MSTLTSSLSIYCMWCLPLLVSNRSKSCSDHTKINTSYSYMYSKTELVHFFTTPLHEMRGRHLVMKRLYVVGCWYYRKHWPQPSKWKWYIFWEPSQEALVRIPHLHPTLVRLDPIEPWSTVVAIVSGLCLKFRFDRAQPNPTIPQKGRGQRIQKNTRHNTSLPPYRKEFFSFSIFQGPYRVFWIN